MESTSEQESSRQSRKKTRKQLTAKRDDAPIHSATRAGNLALVKEILSGLKDEELRVELLKQNQAGETALYVAAEYGFEDIVHEMMKFHDNKTAGIKANNGYDALHIAAKLGDFDVLKELLKAFPELAMTVDLSNTTALHTAASQGHLEVVNLLLQVDRSLTNFTKSNGKTALHSAARNGHLDVVKALLVSDPGFAIRHDNKGQTALHMAVKGHNLDLVEELLKCPPSMVNVLDMKGNSALHMASRKGRPQIVNKLLSCKETDTRVINKSGETALDTAEGTGNSEVATILREHGVKNAGSIRPNHPARDLKQTVSDIKHGVHTQLQHTHQTSKHVLGIAKRLKKLHREGLDNAINSTTLVAVLIATVAFAAIFTVPGQYAGTLRHGISPGEANIARQTAFMIFFIFDSVALFISLAVVVVKTSLVVIESKAKKKMTAIINKLMWLACVLTAVAFLALSFVVVGRSELWMAVGVTIMGTVIMAGTLGILSYWVIANRIEAKKIRSSRKSSLSRSGSRSFSKFPDTDLLLGEKKKIYAI